MAERDRVSLGLRVEVCSKADDLLRKIGLRELGNGLYSGATQVPNQPTLLAEVPSA
jgi:hypothetical protein